MDSPIKKRTNYSKGLSKEKMERALEKAHLEPHPNLAQIALEYEVSRKSLSDRFHGNLSAEASPGKKPYLTNEEEGILTRFLIDIAGIGFGHTKQSLKLLVQSLFGKELESLTDGWVNYFFHKHPEVAIRRAEALDRLRAREMKNDSIQYYFDQLKIAYEKIEILSNGNQLTAQRVFCMDETALYMNKHSKYIIAKKGAKNVFLVTSNNREHVTLMCHASASGHAGCPYFILPHNIANFFGDSFKGSKFSISKTAYVFDLIFEEWAKFFVEDIQAVRGNPRDWCLLVVDGHACHILGSKGLSILNAAKILALSLPSHSSSILQVHDVSIFKPLKTYFNNALTSETRLHGPKLNLKDLAKILEEPYHAANNPFNIISGFKKVGLFPPNFQWIEQNQETFKIFMINRREAQFDELCDQAQKAESINDRLQRLEFLNLMTSPITSKNKSQCVPQLKRSLSSLLCTAKEHLIQDKKVQIRRNFLGEDPSIPRILNEPERLELLEVEKRKKQVQKRKKEDGKKTKKNL